MGIMGGFSKNFNMKLSCSYALSVGKLAIKLILGFCLRPRDWGRILLLQGFLFLNIMLGSSLWSWNNVLEGHCLPTTSRKLHNLDVGESSNAMESVLVDQ